MAIWEPILYHRVIWYSIYSIKNTLEFYCTIMRIH